MFVPCPGTKMRCRNRASRIPGQEQDSSRRDRRNPWSGGKRRRAEGQSPAYRRRRRQDPGIPQPGHARRQGGRSCLDSYKVPFGGWIHRRLERLVRLRARFLREQHADARRGRPMFQETPCAHYSKQRWTLQYPGTHSSGRNRLPAMGTFKHARHAGCPLSSARCRAG